MTVASGSRHFLLPSLPFYRPFLSKEISGRPSMSVSAVNSGKAGINQSYGSLISNLKKRGYKKIFVFFVPKNKQFPVAIRSRTT